MSHTFRIGPGITYRTDTAGLRELGRSEVIGRAALSVARDMAVRANAEGHGTYKARPRTVTAGWENEDRAGAEVVEVERDSRDVQSRVLVNLTKSYRMRGGS